MAKKGAPQIEDGYTRLANELLEALCKLHCTNAERRLIDAIMRLTYGIYGRKSARIETKELTAMTKLPAWHIGKARAKLKKRNIIIVSLGDNQRIQTYRINKFYRKWKPLAQGPNDDRKANVGPEGRHVGPGGSDVGPGVNPTLYKENIKESLKENSAEPPAPPSPDPDLKSEKTPPAKPPYKKIIDHLNEISGSNFDHTIKETRGAIRARFKSGFSEQDFYDVIDEKTRQWIGDSKMVAYLRPGTLFRPTKFEGYLMEAKRRSKATISTNQQAKERKYKIAAGILRESGTEACLRYCTEKKIDGEDFKQWILKNTGSQ